MTAADQGPHTGPDAPSGGSAPTPPPARLARSAGLIGLATMASRVLGLVREQVLAYLFGAGDAMDAFLVAFRVPNLMRDLFAEGAMSAAFVPTFSRTLTREGRPRAWQLANSVVNALLIVTGGIVVLAVFAAPAIVQLFAAEFADVPGKFALTVLLTRVMVPFLTLVALAAVCMGMLNAVDRFFIPALSPAMFNVGAILSMLALVPLAHALDVPPILAVAAGTLVGGFGQLVVQWPALRAEGYRYAPRLDPTDPDLRRILLLMGPGTIGLAATQVNVFVNTVLATGEGTGAVSWLNYAFRLMYLPIGIFGVSVATAAVPRLSRLAAANDRDGMRSTIGSALGLMLTLNVPATVGLMVLASPIVALIFERGQFTAADTLATAAALRWYALGLLGYSAVKIVTPAFYAVGRSRVPVAVTGVAVFVNMTLNLALVRVMGYQGLALGTSVAALTNAGLLLVLFARHSGGFGTALLSTTLPRVVAASAVMAAVAWGVEQGLHLLLPGAGLVPSLVRVGAAIGAGIVALMVAGHALGLRELEEATAMVRRRLGRRDGGAA